LQPIARFSLSLWRQITQPIRDRRVKRPQALRPLPLLCGLRESRAQMALVRDAPFLFQSTGCLILRLCAGAPSLLGGP
jgi:hypothetical protein